MPVEVKPTRMLRLLKKAGFTNITYKQLTNYRQERKKSGLVAFGGRTIDPNTLKAWLQEHSNLPGEDELDVMFVVDFIVEKKNNSELVIRFFCSSRRLLNLVRFKGPNHTDTTYKI